MFHIRIALIVISASLMTGCGFMAVRHDTDQTVVVKVMTTQGKAIEGVPCKLKAKDFSLATTSGVAVVIPRSDANLFVECDRMGAIGRLERPARVRGFPSSQNFDSGLTGIAVEHATGALYEYASPLVVRIGSSIVETEHSITQNPIEK